MLGHCAWCTARTGTRSLIWSARRRERGRPTAADYGPSRPALLESEAVYRALALAEIAGCDCYIVHVSAAESLDVLRQFRKRPGPRQYAETCPHYLLLDDGDQQRMGGLAKISPPIRGAADQRALWDALRDGEIDVIGSDASGQTRAGKQTDGDFLDVPLASRVSSRCCPSSRTRPCIPTGSACQPWCGSSARTRRTSSGSGTGRAACSPAWMATWSSSTRSGRGQSTPGSSTATPTTASTTAAPCFAGPC